MSTDKTIAPGPIDIQRPPAEVRWADELALLARRDSDQGRAAPAGWALSAQSVVEFVLGDGGQITQKYVGRRDFVERCVVALATNRGLMLIGEPGTAKSLLSELLAAAVSGDTSLTVQGSAATTEDAIKYSWNYALLLAEGPTPRALVPAPVYRGMKQGKVVRFEEITRCPAEVQDSLLSILSDRVLQVPELDDDHRTVFAARGFNVIATANTRDRGVNEMSAALKRRFNFETVGPIADPKVEMALVHREANTILEAADVPARLKPDVTEVLVQVFRELRSGRSGEAGVERLSSAMSTAEAVQTGVAAAMTSAWFGSGTPGGAELASALVGSALKDEPEDKSRLRDYFERHIKKRDGALWRELYSHRGLLG
ncbi:ATP-binding protein [Propionibacteriaceae bacterium G1746]|uniref:ATP-binding protein n=1 Tax=Aestuariimicrobium sp. G57 TaxID=3418485 RepID=UPI003C1CFC27